MGVPTSEVGYTSATAGRDTTKSERTYGSIGGGGIKMDVKKIFWHGVCGMDVTQNRNK